MLSSSVLLAGIVVAYCVCSILSLKVCRSMNHLRLINYRQTHLQLYPFPSCTIISHVHGHYTAERYHHQRHRHWIKSSSSRSYVSSIDTSFDDHHIDTNLIKFYDNAACNIEKKRTSLVTKNKCLSCYLSSTMCICSQVKEFFSAIPISIHPKASIDVFMHYKEWGRASNTGKLLPIGLPNQSKIYMYGRKPDYELLVHKLTTTPSVILYPSDNSTSITDFRSLYHNNNNNNNPTTNNNDSNNNNNYNNSYNDFNICVIDSTWSQSQAMDRCLPPQIPRVNINDFINSPSLFLNRRQVLADDNPSNVGMKISTIEALALALRALDVDRRLVDSLYQALKLSVDATFRQNGKQTIYGHNFIDQMSNVTIPNGPYTASSVRRPSQCCRCGASSLTTIFKNMGLRKLPWTNNTVEEGNTIVNDDDDDDGHHRGADHDYDDNDGEDVSGIGGSDGVGGGIVSGIDGKQLIRVWKCSDCMQFFQTTESSTT